MNRVLCYQFQITVFAFILITAGCTENESQTKEKEGLKKTIRKIEAVYSNYIDSRNRERSLDLDKAPKYYSPYADKFKEIRTQLAIYPKTKKYEPIRTEFDTLTSASLKYFNTQISMFEQSLKVLNTKRSYDKHLDEVIDFFKSETNSENYRKEANKHLGKIHNDSSEFRSHLNKLGNINALHDSLAKRISVSKNQINSFSHKFNLRDSIKVPTDSLLNSPGDSMYNFAKNKNLTPIKDTIESLAEIFESYKQGE